MQNSNNTLLIIAFFSFYLKVFRRRLLMSQEKPLPKITIITPSLNQARYLRQCIDSILMQDYPYLEYFIIDRGSEDETLSIIKEHESHIDYWVSEADNGQSDAINKGFKKASGDLVAWLNAGDYYLPFTFARAADAYRADPMAPFYFGDGLRVDESGATISKFFPTEKLIFSRLALLMGLNYILQPSTFINRRSLEKVGYLEDRFNYGMDSDLWLKLSEIGTPHAIEAVLAATREYSTTKTASGSFGQIEELRNIAEKHSGLPITPGMVCYYMDTLYRFVQQHDDVFPSHYLKDIIRFWKKTQKLLIDFDADPNGFPKGLSPQTMRIGIDLRQLVLGAGGGISLQTKETCEHIFALYPEHQFFIFCTPFNRSLLDFDASYVRFFSLPILTYFQELDQLIIENDIDVLFRAYPMEDTLQFPINKQIFLIPDIQHESYPDFFSDEVLRARRAAFSKALGGAGAIGTVSLFSQKTLREFSETRCEDVFLMPPALQISHKIEECERKLSDAEYKLIPQSDFFLFPANLWKHKNHRILLQAFQLFKEKSGIENMSLILTGHTDGWPELQSEFNELPVAHLGFVRPELLRELYERARALVFFSLYEGFGMPLLEAFDAGTPVICSNTTSLPEVGGDAVLTCDPTNKFAIAALMERIQFDELLRKRLINRGRERLVAYTWEDSAHSLIAACERVVQRHTDLPQKVYELQEPLPLVSIVTPSYNQGRFIERTIESVLSQRYPKIEYVVIDGGSSDKTLKILESYGNQFDWISEPDRGQTDAINKGMARVHGEIRAYLNSDDILMPNAIEKVVHYFQNNPDCDMIYGNADYIDEEDRVIGRYPTADYSFGRLLQDCMVCQPAAFWRKRIADKIGPFDENCNYAMDYDYWIRIAKSGGNMSFLPEKLAHSRLYQETKTRSARTEIYKEIFRICKMHVGCVDLSYYHGYWHHLIYEKENIFSRALRRFPNAFAMVAWLHQTWDLRERYAPGQIADFLIKRIKRRLEKISFVRNSIKILGKILVETNLRVFSRAVKVRGYDADNWLGPTVTIAPSNRVIGHNLHIAGVAPIDMEMTVSAGNEEICSFTFKKQQYQKAIFPAEAVDGQQIIIQFSSFITDNCNRRKSFRLHDTNIFIEADTV